MKTITLGQREFIVKNYNQTTNMWLRCHRFSENKDIKDAYKYPSYTKQRVWNDWKEWAETYDIKDIKVDSHNHFYFTIGMILKIDGQRYLLHITAWNNYAVKLDW